MKRLNSGYVVVGSRALDVWGVLPRPAKDWDIIATREGAEFFLSQFKEIRRVETQKGFYALVEDGYPVEVELVEKNKNTLQIFNQMKKTTFMGYVSPSWVYFLKMSHRFKKFTGRRSHFEKTRKDILHLRSLGVEMPQGFGLDSKLFKERERITYNYKHPSLAVKKENFFSGDGINYVYDHDSIHEVVALGEQPAYTYFLKDGSEVMVDRKKWDNLSERVRLLSCMEEAAVLAAERSLIPFGFKPLPDEAFMYALQKVCTSITSGWFREFSWENYDKVVDLYHKECQKVWVDKIKAGLETGRIRKLEV